ncbi:MAG: hypothetical protein RMX68_006175 [Aulosira sp. ZfuVER01]|nr:hypothetical protein [Aulosira sp. ZfuVER01]MDZ8001511.1 hypothetical protein [Aulosira sp. DedVER01a]MDZ8051621.1 hypothetical protein [Aulosira sp. ZfuCHP01]
MRKVEPVRCGGQSRGQVSRLEQTFQDGLGGIRLLHSVFKLVLVLTIPGDRKI